MVSGNTLSLILDVGSVVVWGYAAYLVILMAHEGYGKRFTSVYPHLIGSILVFTVLAFVELVHFELVLARGLNASAMFQGAMKTMQLIGGTLLAASIHKIYNINYATHGFMGEEE